MTFLQMTLIIPFIFVSLFQASIEKITYFNLENIYGPYCDPNKKFSPDAGIVRYAGTPWVGRCVLNLESCCLPTFLNGTLIPNLPTSTRFFIHLMVPPLCFTENVTIQAESGETIHIDCTTKNSTEYFLDTERLKIVYNRSEKMPISKFSMVVTPMKQKTRMYSPCGFDCFSDTFCIHTSLVCDRYKSCPNNVDESYCDYYHHHEPLSLKWKIILSAILLTIVLLAISTIIICYFCCGISNRHHQNSMTKYQKQNHRITEEGIGASKPLLS